MLLRTASSVLENVLIMIVAIREDFQWSWISDRHMLFLTALNIGTLVPLFWVQVHSSHVFAPWTTKACEEKLIPETIAFFYQDMASRTNQTFPQTCQEFSNDGRLLWSVL